MIGSTISHYQIIDKLGEGGMGVVYKAQDTTLNRAVALKFLPPHVSGSEQDKARFLQEAQSAAALNHPNICTIHGIDEAEGRQFIVMEDVDGQTLQEKKSTLSLKQVIEIGIQIAEGLAVAHEKGIVHRDVKPENIMIRKDGIAQIMDFGLAKLRGVTRLTKEGSTIGTAGYMSPEQVQGLETDQRSDIFSLGVLLFEMITGQLPFKGIHETAVAYEIVNVDSPPPPSIRPEIPPELDAIVLECLEKDPNERTQFAKQVALDLKRFKRESSRQRMSRITTVVLAAGVYELLLRPAARSEVIWASVQLPRGISYANTVGGNSAISPDGSMIVLGGIDSSFQRSLWVRPLYSPTLRPLPGTKDAEYPFWSYDSKSIGFFSEGKLRTTSALGGPVLSLADAPLGRGGAWGSKGIIVFSPNVADANLYAVPSGGGTVHPVTAFDSATGLAPRFPAFLPGGEKFLFTSVELAGRATNTIAYVGSINGDPPKEIGRGMSSGMVAAGHLLFLRQGILMAQRFNESSLTLEGDAMSIQERVNSWAPRAKGDFSASENGILVSSIGEEGTKEEVTWVDADGRQQPVLSVTPWTFVRLSPDEKQLTYDEVQGQDQRVDIWIYDLVRGVKTRFTFGSKFSASFPIWSRDGSKVIFSSEVGPSKANVFEKRSDGAGQENLLVRGPNPATYLAPLDVSPDGRTLLLSEVLGNHGELCTVDLSDPKRPLPLSRLNITALDAKFSPDGKWIISESNESGNPEVFVRSLQKDGGQWQISSGGGQEPLWLGKDIIFYSSTRDAYMKVEVSFTGGNPSFGQARTLFPPSTVRFRQIIGRSKDGRRHLVVRRNSNPATSTMSVIVNWPQLLKK